MCRCLSYFFKRSFYFDGFVILTLLTLVSGGWDELKQMEEKAETLRKYLEKNSGSHEGWLQLGTVLHLMDNQNPNGGKRVPEALQAYRTALGLSPGQNERAAVSGNMGALLMSAGRLTEALHVIEGIIQMANEGKIPKEQQYVGALFNMGKTLGMLGQTQEAAETYIQAIEAARGISPGTFTKCYASLRSHTDEQVRDMEAAAGFLSGGSKGGKGLSQRERRQRRKEAAEAKLIWGWMEGISPPDLSWLHFALYSAYTSRKDAEKAWVHLAEANRLQKLSTEHDENHDEQLLKLYTSMFNPDPSPDGTERASNSLIKKLLEGNAGYRDPTPIFVVGMPRSGSTLIEQILASHPDVWGAGEDTALAPLIPELIKALSSPEGVNVESVQAVGRAYVAEMRAGAPKGRLEPERIVDKMLRNAWNVGYIAMMLPRSCVVHAVRHPLDVALSCFAQPFEGRGTPWAWDLNDIAQQIELTEKIMALWERVLPGRVLRLPYESIIADQEGASRRLLEHCGLEWDPSVLDFHASNRPVQTASLAQVRQKLYTSSVGKWKQFERQLQPVAQRLKTLVKAYEKEVGLQQSEEEEEVVVVAKDVGQSVPAANDEL